MKLLFHKLKKIININVGVTGVETRVTGLKMVTGLKRQIHLNIKILVYYLNLL